LNKASRNGDAEAISFFETLWTPYLDRAMG